MRYKHSLPDSKKAAHILRPETLHYADVLTAEERSYCWQLKRVCTSKELIECMGDTWKPRGGTPYKKKTADKLTLANHASLRKKEAECWYCGKKSHTNVECKAEKKKKDNKQPGGNTYVSYKGGGHK